MSLTANYVEGILLLPSLCYCAENAGDEIKNVSCENGVMKSGSGSCRVVGC